MAFRQVSGYLYLASSADDKRTDGVTQGAECVETDTGSRFVFDNGAWFRTAAGIGELLAVNQEMLAELKQLRETYALQNGV